MDESLLISELSHDEIKKRLILNGLRIKMGCFNIAINSKIPAISKHIPHFYGAYECLNNESFVDICVDLKAVGGYRKWYKPQVDFSFDGYKPFAPLPLSQAPAMLEWGINWCVANNAHHFLIIHAAIVEKNGQGLILPGTPGSGKSTLCAALVNQGWRLLSDEMALVSLEDGMVYPAPRPVSLKNQSIQIIKDFAPDAIFGDIIEDTLKGDIAHMVVPQTAVTSVSTPVKPAFLVYPHYQANSEQQLTVQPKSRALMTLGEHAFNFNVLGKEGFDSMVRLVDQVACYDFTYPDLDSALTGINSLV